MNIRKLGIIGGFAAGAAALALAPAASAAPASDAFDFGNILAGEVKSMNFLFEAEAAIAGVKDEEFVKGTPTAADPQSFDHMVTGGNLENEVFAHLLYGIDPEKAGESSLTGSYNIFNGATTQFTDANNVLLYALLNGGDQIDPAKVDVSDILMGSKTGIEDGLSGDSVFADFGNFFGAGVNDLLGYFDLPSIDI